MTQDQFSCEQFATVLPDYLEGGLADAAAADAELHLAACVSCRSVVADLRELTRQAAALPDMVPSRDLWPEIQARTEPRVLPLSPARAAPVAWRRWRLGAIAAAVVGITAVSTYTLGRRTSDAGVAQRQGASSDAPRGVAARGSAGVLPASSSGDGRPIDVAATYTLEIDRLRLVLSERAQELDPRTVAILETSVATIDSAIAQARTALASDPASAFLSQQLNKSLERKLGVLRQAALLPST